MNQIPSASPYITVEERKMLMKHNNVRATLELAFHLFLIFASFFLIHLYPSVFTILPALFLLGGQQLALAILMHDSSHHSVFSNKAVNDFVGNWFGAYPLFNHMPSYRPYHQTHHLTAGTIEDPDLALTRGYPTTKMSMVRKFTRDLLGITGFKSTSSLILMSMGFLTYTQAGTVEWAKKGGRKVNWRGVIGPVVVNVLLFVILAVLFDPRMYLIWLLAHFTTFQFCARVRAIAEHSMVDDPTDPNRNTRTTKAKFIERLLFAPYNVNYHLEHHMIMTVPSYNLPKMHKLLVERGFYEKGLMAKGYFEVIKMTVQKLK